MTHSTYLVATEDHAWQRLDRVLEVVLPDMGLRGRRRLCGLGLVLVNGKAAPEAKKIKPGDVLEIMAAHDADHAESPQPAEASFAEKSTSKGVDLAHDVRLVEHDERWAALYKPVGLHTESLAGKPGVSLQKILPNILNGIAAPDVEIMLVNRLDFPTSGLVIAALNWQSATVWETAQRNGHTEKRYLALLEGVLPCMGVARHTLCSKGRQRVLAMQDDYPDRRRHTVFEPLAVLDAECVAEVVRAFFSESDSCIHEPSIRPGSRQVTLAGCTILKGARHQIRAHASAMGFPLLGDVRYGAAWALSEENTACSDEISPEQEHFFLHHGRIVMPDFSATIAPPWLSLLGQDAELAAMNWLLK